ncbi:MAG: hypothetical protein BAA01_14870 [Bacillus thermozeamaize]|jgi:hypothetical protein|uniref:DUF327 domain-containing protein n=1 Tax=Bacillus thermozeamaize TaxID=230954 RepID=A0A1Y3PDB3_9BACI|nr:MAG: hypothetical protein BAA01_14870 [Bacillus thermozeamaize]
MEISFRPEKAREKLPGRGGAPLSQVAGGERFASLLQHKLQAGQSLEEQLLAIDEQANRLATLRTMEELVRYRERVKAFLQTVLQRALAVETVQVQERRRIRQYRLVQQVDELLLKLASEVLEKEIPRLAILSRLDQIRGLLVNLST